MNDERAKALIDRQFAEGALPDEEARALRELLDGSEEARAYYDKHVRMERALEDAPLPDAQLARLEALGPPAPAAVVDQDLVGERRSRGGLFTAVGAITALAAGLALVALLDDGEHIQARGGPGDGKTAWINLFTADGKNVKPLASGDRIEKGSGLLFSYSTLRETPYRYFAIAGRDQAGSVHWFHPAFVEGVDPKSLPLERGVADKELSERVFADFAPGRLEICAIFTKTAVEVVEADQRLEREGRWPDNAKLDCRTVEVKP